MWVPGKTSSLCSKYFAPDDFQRPLNTEVNFKRDLEKDEIGVCVFPSIHANGKMTSRIYKEKGSVNGKKVFSHLLETFSCDFSFCDSQLVLVPSKLRKSQLFCCFSQIARSAKAHLKTLQEPEVTSIVYPSTSIQAVRISTAGYTWVCLCKLLCCVLLNICRHKPYKLKTHKIFRSTRLQVVNWRR